MRKSTCAAAERDAIPTKRAPEIPVHTRRERERLDALEFEIAVLGEPQTEKRRTRTRFTEKRARSHCRKPPRLVMVTQAVPPRTIRVLPRGNWLDETGPVVEPAIPAFLGNAESAGQGDRASTSPTGSPTRRTASAAHGPRLRQSPLVSVLRRRPVEIARRLRRPGRAAGPPRTARQPRRRVRQRLGRQALVKTHRHEPRLSPILDRHELKNATPRIGCLRARAAGGCRPRSIRDNALAVSGLLVLEVGGPPRQALPARRLLPAPQLPQTRIRIATTIRTSGVAASTSTGSGSSSTRC